MKKDKLNTKLSSFCSDEKEKNNDEVLLVPKDGLFEKVEYVNKKYVTEDGRQLLKETLFEV